MLPSLAFNVCVGNLHADPQACKAGTVPTEPWPGSLICCFRLVYSCYLLPDCTEQLMLNPV